eukprot:8871226-Prorocentrum_lima.AAC.1
MLRQYSNKKETRCQRSGVQAHDQCAERHCLPSGGAALSHHCSIEPTYIAQYQKLGGSHSQLP